MDCAIPDMADLLIALQTIMTKETCRYPAVVLTKSGQLRLGLIGFAKGALDRGVVGMTEGDASEGN
jgi:hypothetical protein